MRIFGIEHDSIVDGPGLRVAVFAQGCPHNCVGCHNPDSLDPKGGYEQSIEEIWSEIEADKLASGITFSGGEPLAQAAEFAELAKLAKSSSKQYNIWLYSGYTFEQLIKSKGKDVKSLLNLCDVLVDGPFIESKKSLDIPWRGSSNQRLIDLPKSMSANKALEWIASSPAAPRRDDDKYVIATPHLMRGKQSRNEFN